MTVQAPHQLNLIRICGSESRVQRRQKTIAQCDLSAMHSVSPICATDSTISGVTPDLCPEFQVCVSHYLSDSPLACLKGIINAEYLRQNS